MNIGPQNWTDVKFLGENQDGRQNKKNWTSRPISLVDTLNTAKEIINAIMWEPFFKYELDQLETRPITNEQIDEDDIFTTDD